MYYVQNDTKKCLLISLSLILRFAFLCARHVPVERQGSGLQARRRLFSCIFAIKFLVLAMLQLYSPNYLTELCV
jgi:hypothetical protein